MEKEIKYWVIKNPDTGLYFRGKGANRWGKYLNQASIYRVRGTVESSCEEINHYGRNGERAVVVEIKITEVSAEIDLTDSTVKDYWAEDVKHMHELNE